MSVSLKEFQAFTVRITDDLRDLNGRRPYLWTVPPLFNPQHLIIDPRYFKGDIFPLIC